MKKFLFWALFVVMVVSACAPVAQFVPLPEAEKAAIQVLVVVVLGLALDFAIGYFSWLSFLKAYQVEWGMGLAALLIPYIENILPGGAFEPASILFVQFLLALAAIWMAARKFFARRGFRAFKE